MRHVTRLFVFCVLGLTFFGLVMVYSVSPLLDSSRFVLKQLIACGIGMILGVLAASSDYQWLRKLGLPWLIYVLGVSLLALVVAPGIGVTVNGATRWFRLPGNIMFQPSDFAKPALIIALAHYGAKYQGKMPKFGWGVLLPGLMMALVMGLLIKEPDWGTSLLVMAVGTVMILVAGARWQHLEPIALAGVLAIVALLLTNPNRVDRFISWLHPEETKETSGYQGWQSRLALAHGGTAGVGFTLSTQKQVLPEHHTDFIFAIIGEEFGLIGTVTVTWVLMLVFLSSLFIAWHAADTFGQFLGVGISFLFGLQSLVNVGVVTGLLPNKGLPLPFVSYGGSNLTMMLMCAGILVSIARRAGVTSEADSSVMSPVNAPVIRLA